MGWFTTLEVGQLPDGGVWSEVFEVPDCSMVALDVCPLAEALGGEALCNCCRECCAEEA